MNEAPTRTATVLSVAALVVSVFSLGWTVVSQVDQDRRWDELNSVGVDLVDVDFRIIRVLSQEAFEKTDWAPIPTSTGNIGMRDGDRHLLRYELLFRNPKANLIADCRGLVEPRAFFECGNQKLIHPGSWAAIRRYEVTFFLKNLGNTAVDSLELDISARHTGMDDWVSVSPSRTPLSRLGPGIPFRASSTFDVGIRDPFPRELSYRLKISFRTSSGEPVTRTIVTTYDRDARDWGLVSRS